MSHHHVRHRIIGAAVLTAGLLLVWTCLPEQGGPMIASANIEGADCNGNDADDSQDIADGLSLDCDGDGVPDECQADGSSTAIGATLVASSLGFATAIEASPHDPDYLLVGLKTGRITVIDLPTGAALIPPFLDISSRVTASSERGLLSIAFDPADPLGAFVYVTYNEKITGELRISRFAVDEDGRSADPDSEQNIATIEHPTSTHNGGQLRFGPDGYLYCSSGDGTNYVQSDPQNNAQNGQLLLGKLIRLDVHAPPDFVPADNPFVDDPEVRDEIWALGLRNPWRFSFDRLTGDLYLTDVGLDEREEINVQPAASGGGRNYGWRCLEGTRCTGFDAPCSCDDPTLVGPAFEISRSGGCWAVIGGFVYRGCHVPALHGRYLYANYCDGGIYSLRVNRNADGSIVLDDQRDHTEQLNRYNASLITTFGEDREGELYFASLFGSVWRIETQTADCNGNGVPDHEDLDAGTSADCNGNFIPDECDADEDGNGVPDECELTGDVNGDGTVDVDDLTAVITSWGICSDAPVPCPADLDRDGFVGVDDLMLVILNWG